MQRINKPTAVAIGKFNGTHIGHQKLIRELADTAKANGLKPVVLLINTDTAHVEDKEEQKQRLISFGAEEIIELDLTPEIREMSAENFLKDILLDRLSMKYLVGGTDLAFGYQRMGNTEFLAENAEKLGFRYKLIEKVCPDAAVIPEEPMQNVSSTLLRKILFEGDMEAVNQLAGKAYDITGPVLHGRHIGTELLGVPTINQAVDRNRSLPPFGVYVSRVSVYPDSIETESCPVNGKEPDVYYGISDLGIKPSINEGKDPVSLETHLLNCNSSEDLYGKNVKTELLHYIRPERYFGSLDELTCQITEKDLPEAKAYLKKNFNKIV